MLINEEIFTVTEEFKFELIKTDSGTRARAGKLTTPHGTVDTPYFMPVGTQATVKAMSPGQVVLLEWQS